MGAIETLEKMREILAIPYMAQIFSHKLNELYSFFDYEVAYLTQARKQFKKSVYPAMEIRDADDLEESERGQVYFFEAMGAESEPWQVSIEPLPPPGHDIHDILPLEIVTEMATYEVKTRHIHSIRDHVLPHLRGVVFDLEFIHYSPDYIMGTVIPRKTNHKITATESPLSTPELETRIYQYDPSGYSDEVFLKELMYYIKTYPALKGYFATELQMRIMPLIHGNLVELTANSRPEDQS